LIRKSGCNKSFEERMRLVWFALKFGVILAANKVGVITQLDQFGERAVGGCS
jgi:hypothetical protein